MPAQGPLSDVRVLEIGGIGPGPFAGMMLAELGADVIRVDNPPGTTVPSPIDPAKDLLNRGKRSVSLDLKSDAGLSTCLQLVEKADVLVEGFRPGVTERLGIGPSACWERRPQLVYGRMTGWGQSGPLAERAGHDINYISLTGALGGIGRRGDAPAIPLNLVGDFGGGSLYLVVGILAALREAERTGRGQVIDAAIVDGVSHLMTATFSMMNSGTWSDQRGSNLIDGGRPFYDVYRTSDGEYMSVGCLEPKFYREFVTLLGVDISPAEQMDVASWPRHRELIETAFAGGSQAEWIEHFRGTDACVAPVRSVGSAVRDEHLVDRESLMELSGSTVPGAAPRFSDYPDRTVGAPPLPGEHTLSALADWGIDGAERLVADGAAFTASAT